MGGHIENSTQIYVKNSSLFDYICVEHALLFQIMRNCILRQKRSLEADFGSHPFALSVWRIRRMITSSAAAELWAEVRALDLVKLVDLAPSLIADGPGYVNL
jgi:hypothetical protein